MALGVGSLTAGPAFAAPTSNLVFSVDGGTTWSANVNAAPGQTVYAREYYDNDSTGTIAGAQVTTTMPTGFSLVAGSTKVCLNPGTTNPTAPTIELACNTDAGQGGAINEAAVWTGQNLAISPTAGIYGQPTNQTTGPLAMGKTKYLNVDNCDYTNNTDDNYTNLVHVTNSGGGFDAGTNASDTATALSCGPGGGSFVVQAASTAAQNIDLLAQGWFNLEQCDYIEGQTNDATWMVNDTPSTNFNSSTDASNTEVNPTNTSATAPTCGPGSGSEPYAAENSGVLSLGLLDNRYVNLDECTYYDATSGDTYTTVVNTTNSGGAFDAGTNASGTAATALSCGAGIASYPFLSENSGLLSLDTLDTTRGQGFVQWQMTAPSPASTTVYTEDGQLTGTGTGDPTTSGTITIDASVGTPLANAWVLGGLVALVVLSGGGVFALARRRRMRTAA
jgi:hypothetical protein